MPRALVSKTTRAPLLTNSWISTLRRFALGGACLTLVAGGAALPARAAVDPNDPNVVVRPITSLPIQDSFTYRDDFGDPRTGHTHQGNDLMVSKLRPLLAVTDATVRRIFVDNGTASQGNMLVLRDADGWEYAYLPHQKNHPRGGGGAGNPH